MWTRRCDIDVQMCGRVEVERRGCERVKMVCRRRCADATAAQRCASGAPTLVHFSLRKHNAEEVRIKLI